MSKTIFDFFSKNRIFSRVLIGFTIIFLAFSWLLPMVSQQAHALQITQRSLTLSSGVPSATGTTWTYTFQTATSSALQSIKFVVCTTAVATYGLASTSATTGCTAPATGNLVNQGTQQGTLTGSWTNTTGFTRTTSTTGNCAPGNNVLCVTRTQAAAETNISATRTIAWNTQTNPSTSNTAFYVGIYTYSDTAYATPVDSGTVASAVVQTLTVNAAVAEILNFCVGSTTVDDATTSVSGDCASGPGVSGTSVNLGTLDSSHINITPVATNCTASDCSKNGVAMVRSNAINGTVVYYDAIQQSGTNHVGTLRISGATCAADSVNLSTDSTDQCFNQRTAQATFTAGTERYGFTVAGVNCGSTTSYTCTFAAGTYNLQRDAAYDGTGGNTYNTTDKDQIVGSSTNGYAWDESGTATALATSGSSTTKVIDDESLILKFAATPAITTPFGSYTAKADFIAVSTY
jgi:hypothetical protein